MSSETWTKIAIVFEAIPFFIMFYQYVIRTSWTGTPVGKAIAWFIAAGASTFAVSIVAAFFPDSEPLRWIRVVLRFIIGLGIWNLLIVLRDTQNEAEAKEREKSDTGEMSI